MFAGLLSLIACASSAVFGQDEKVPVIGISGVEALEVELAEASSPARARELEPRFIHASATLAP